MRDGACLESKRCQNATAKIIALLATLKHRHDYRQIAELTHAMLNLAAFKDASGEEEFAKRIHSGLRKALPRFAAGHGDFSTLTSGERQALAVTLEQMGRLCFSVARECERPKGGGTMKASAVIRQRRAFGNWLAYALPDDTEDTRTPDPPPERKEAQRPSCAPSDSPTPAKTTTAPILP